MMIDSLFNQNNRFKLLVLQSEMEKKLKGKIWRKIIKAKVKNQKICIVNNSKKATIKYFERMYEDIKYNDSDNIEAITARKYFKCLFGNKFSRKDDNLINQCLNYGYAILRSTIRKSLIIEDFEPTLGIYHKSQKNNFNLADDLIEPFRPILDNLVIDILNYSEDEELSWNIKHQLIKILFEKCIIDNKIKYVGDAIKIEIQSLKNF